MTDEKPYSDSLTWQRVAEWPPWRCPRCQHLPDDGFAWVTGDALPHPAGDRPERYDATLLWGDCTACGEALYRLEITSCRTGHQGGGSFRMTTAGKRIT